MYHYTLNNTVLHTEHALTYNRVQHTPLA